MLWLNIRGTRHFKDWTVTLKLKDTDQCSNLLFPSEFSELSIFFQPVPLTATGGHQSVLFSEPSVTLGKHPLVPVLH